MGKRICKAADCDRPVEGKGYCRPHYRRWRVTGDAREHIPIGHVYDPTPEERFWAKVDKEGPAIALRPDLGPCWVWTSPAKTHGYGLFQAATRKTVRAHRFAYEIVRGPIPQGLDLDHLCHTYDPKCEGGIGCPHRCCVNPAHLEPVSEATNTYRSLRSPAGANKAKTHCHRGHPFDDANTHVNRKGQRICRQCSREDMRRRRAAKRSLD